MRVGQPALKVAGNTLCVIGALLLAFVGYQLWGTSLSEHSAQARLRTELMRSSTATRRPPHSPRHCSPPRHGPDGDTLESTA